MTWYVAITNPNCHRRAESELASLGYRAFWPKLRKWVSHARTKVPKEYPILGRYLFVEVPPGGDFWTVRAVNGIEAVVTATNEDGDQEPLPVPYEVVLGFMCRYHSGEWDYVSKDIIPIGARVQIIEGEFAKQLVTIIGRRRGKLQFIPPGKRDFVSIREEKVWAA